MMGWADPIWLYGLLGLAVPIAIHLLSRKDTRVIHIGSLRHLQDSITRQAIRIRLNEYLLLAVRCMIVALAVMLLAGLFFDTDKPERKWLLIERGLERDRQWMAVIDSLEAQGFSLKEFATGFPALESDDINANEGTGAPGQEREVITGGLPDYWTLTEALNALDREQCVVISRSRVPGFSGQRAANASVIWLTAHSDTTRFTLMQKRISEDTVVIRQGWSDDLSMSFETLKLHHTHELVAKTHGESQYAGATPSDTSRLEFVQTVDVVVSGATGNDDERIVLAALRAIDSNGLVSVRARVADPANVGDGDWLIWLSPDDLPQTTIKRIIRTQPQNAIDRDTRTPAQGNSFASRALAVGMSTSHGLLIVPSASGTNTWHIRSDLTPTQAINGRLTLHLASLLLEDDRYQLMRVANLYDRRIMPEGERFTLRSTGPSIKTMIPEENHPSGSILAVILITLIGAERVMANRRQL